MVGDSIHPQHVLAVIAEPLAAGRRVAVFGDASVGLDATLVDCGARSVTVFDPDAERARAAADGAPPGASVRHFTSDDPGPRGPDPRSVDVAIVPDLGLFADPADVISRVRRLVGEYGVAIVGAANREAGEVVGTKAFDYYELFDLVAREFHGVRMVAQLPFYGIALMELGGEDDTSGVNVDTRLAEGGRAPEAFVVVASQRADRSLDPYSIVELPAPAVPAVSASLIEELAEDGVAMAALAEAQLRANVLETQLEETRARAGEGDRALEALPALEAEIMTRARRVSELEAALANSVRAIAELSAEVEKARAGERGAEEARRAATSKLEQAARGAEHVEKRAAALEHEIEHGGGTQAAELVRLEQGLRESAQAVRALEGEVARRDQMVRDLVGALDEARLAPSAERPAHDAASHDALVEANAQLRGRLDALALELARREGAEQASTWTIHELERKLAQVSGAGGPRDDEGKRGGDPARAPSLAAALDELDTLRKAFVLEHDARVRAESGEALARARAEIERQSVLLNQLSGSAAR